jgi:hypothetical protein
MMNEENKEIQERGFEKKEKLIQTYIIIYGLLLTCAQSLDKWIQFLSFFIFISFLFRKEKTCEQL